MRDPHISGWCNNPSTSKPERSHGRCRAMGHGNRFNPNHEFSPCSCPCHFPDPERYECGECGGVLAVAPWPDEDAEANGTEPEEVYTHMDANGYATGFECPGNRRKAPAPEQFGDEGPDEREVEEDDEFADLEEDEEVSGNEEDDFPELGPDSPDWSEPDLDEDEPDYAEMEDDFPDLEDEDDDLDELFPDADEPDEDADEYDMFAGLDDEE